MFIALCVVVYLADWQNQDMILVFCAFGAEYGPLRARLRGAAPLGVNGLVGSRGRVGKHEIALVKTGIGARRAQQIAARALDSIQNIDLVVITGVAGALHPGLKVGSVVFVDRLLTRRQDSFHAERMVEIPRQHFQTFGAALTGAALSFSPGALLTSHRAIASVADKRLAAVQSGAIAVDMESAVVGEEASSRGLPFICLRTILDEADEALIGAALADENGQVRPLAAVKSIVTNPAMLVGAARLMRNLRTSTRALASAIESALERFE